MQTAQRSIELNTTQDPDLSPEQSTAEKIDQVVIHFKTRRVTHLIVCGVAVSKPEEAPGTFAIMQGARVVTNDGKPIWSVERVVAKRDKNGPKNYLIAKALLLKEKRLIPVEWIDSFGDSEVRLAGGWNSRTAQTARER